MAMRYLKEIDSGYDPVGNKQEKDKNPGRRKKETEGQLSFQTR